MYRDDIQRINSMTSDDFEDPDAIIEAYEYHTDKN